MSTKMGGGVNSFANGIYVLKINKLKCKNMALSEILIFFFETHFTSRTNLYLWIQVTPFVSMLPNLPELF